MTNDAQRLRGRLAALRDAIEGRDWEYCAYLFNLVAVMAERLLDSYVPAEPTTGDQETWTALRPARWTPPGSDPLLPADVAKQAGQPEMWKNELYTVIVTRRPSGGVAELSIRRNDRMPAKDWRHFQRIKTEIAGAETEAFELYPRESRLMDTANQYYLWVLPPSQDLPVGYVGPRLLADADTLADTGADTNPGTNARQRRLPADWTATYDDVVAAAAVQSRDHP